MKTAIGFLAAASIFSTCAHAHYAFGHLVVNNTSSDVWKYIRPPLASWNNAASSASTGKADQPAKGKPGAPLCFPDNTISPDPALRAMPQHNKDVLSPNIRCGRDGWMPQNSTATADILAGSTVGFRPELIVNYYCFLGYQRYDSISHIGPGQAYLAKKPDGVQLSQWDGDGDWFKIDYTGPATNTSWKLLGAKQYDVTIPKSTPPGEYLLRVEHIYPSFANTSEFFVNCAQVNIIGPGGGTPTEFAKFPGTYKPDEPALSLPDGEEIVNGSDAAAIRWKHGFLSYVPPGPALWTG